MKSRLLLIDNFDSFTWNLQHYAVVCGFDVEVKRNTISVEDVQDLSPDAILFSPGPSHPNSAGNMMPILEEFFGKIPMLGICLGHQAIGLQLGFSLTHADKPMHGKVSSVFHFKHDLFNGINCPFEVMRYHSLILKGEADVPGTEMICETENHEIMGIYHEELKLCGLQFHPESIGTPEGIKILQNWKELNFR